MALADKARIAERKPTYPENHRPAMRVPLGGSSCSTCRYVAKDHLERDICTNIHFIKWHGSYLLPLPPDEYCSDWFEPQKGTLS